MTVEAYLNKRAMGNSPKRFYSIKSKKTGKNFDRVVHITPFILLENVSFVVQQSGRNDTLSRIASGSKISKTVHAFLRGNLLNRGRGAVDKFKQIKDLFDWYFVGYNPTKTDSFVITDTIALPDDCSNLDKIANAKLAFCNRDGILVAL